jgi:hypothetical protein
VNRRRLPALAIVLVIGSTGCGDAEDGAAGSTSISDRGSTTTPGPAATAPTSTASTTTPTVATPSVTPPVKDTTPDDGAPTTSPEVPVPDPSTPSGSNVELAVSDLATRLGVDASGIEVVSVDEVTWPDGSLGCPRPGMSYTQALVDGQLIVLAVEGTEYEYHSGRGGEPFYCPADQATPPAAGGGYGDT